MPSAWASMTATSWSPASCTTQSSGQVGAFAHELGIDGDERIRGEAAAEQVERFGGGDQLRGGTCGA